jgi:hypothetical protein
MTTSGPLAGCGPATLPACYSLSSHSSTPWSPILSPTNECFSGAHRQMVIFLSGPEASLRTLTRSGPRRPRWTTRKALTRVATRAEVHQPRVWEGTLGSGGPAACARFRSPPSEPTYWMRGAAAELSACIRDAAALARRSHRRHQSDQSSLRAARVKFKTVTSGRPFSTYSSVFEKCPLSVSSISR